MIPPFPRDLKQFDLLIPAKCSIVACKILLYILNASDRSPGLG